MPAKAVMQLVEGPVAAALAATALTLVLPLPDQMERAPQKLADPSERRPVASMAVGCKVMKAAPWVEQTVPQTVPKRATQPEHQGLQQRLPAMVRLPSPRMPSRRLQGRCTAHLLESPTTHRPKLLAR